MIKEALEPEMYTYEDLKKIDDDKRYEIFDGELFMMSAPVVKHQIITGEIFTEFNKFFSGKKCRPFISPVDVLLDGKGKDSENVVQPDVLVVCDQNKIGDQINGVPDLVVEVISPSSIRYDKIHKYALYQKFGVREYWQVSLTEGIVYIYTLDEKNRYTLKRMCCIEETIKSEIFKELEISLEKAFENNAKIFEEDIKNYLDYKTKKIEKSKKQYIKHQKTKKEGK